MKICILLSVIFFFTSCEGIPNYMGTKLQKCLNCLCHARTGCFNRLTCARYSINFDYWKKANSPVIDVDDEPDSEESYKKCMKNENCVLATLDKYVEAIGHMDCNCDGEFDCKDRFAIHLFGSKCASPEFGAIRATRFNSCAQGLGVREMLSTEGEGGCSPEVFK